MAGSSARARRRKSRATTNCSRNGWRFEPCGRRAAQMHGNRNMKRKIVNAIISCAITCCILESTLSPYLLLTPYDFKLLADTASDLGLATLHLHARDPVDGRPTPDPEIFGRFVPRIKAATDAVINITTGGSTRMSLAERLAYPLLARPEMCSLNMGSMNFSIHPVARRMTEW